MEPGVPEAQFEVGELDTLESNVLNEGCFFFWVLAVCESRWTYAAIRELKMQLIYRTRIDHCRIVYVRQL